VGSSRPTRRRPLRGGRGSLHAEPSYRTVGGGCTSPADPISASVAEHENVSPELREAAGELRELVIKATARRPAECMLLSGGLDTAVLAPLAHQGGTRAAVTVLTSADAPDRPFAHAVASQLGWAHYVVEAPLEELVKETEFVVRTLRSFDPMEIRNSLVIARALREVAARGYRSAMTGDAADELFGGYSFMWEKSPEDFEEYSRRMAVSMKFSSHPLGAALGIEVRAPYTDAAVISFATGLPKRLKVAERDGATVGKWVLRWAFPECPSRWRRKDPIEVGSGSAHLPTWYASRTPVQSLSEERARIRREDRVEIRDAEHLAYYQAFRRAMPDLLSERAFGRDTCAHCGFDLPRFDSTFCTTCGAYPARP
jgi:asparagine synthase (glutamine-hydrolysing)